MGEAHPSSLAEAISAAPAGVALLARLEADQRSDVAWFDSPIDSHPDAVDRAARRVDDMSLGELVALVLSAAEGMAGPWVPDAATKLAIAYRWAPQRRGIAEAISRRFAAPMHAPIDLEGQQWWHSNRPKGSGFDRALFTELGSVYGNGEFTFGGLWTVTDPPPETHDELVNAWELFPGPISRWHLPVRAGARVWEIHRPEDWTRLVEAYPKSVDRAHMGWELPGPNQDGDAIRELLGTAGQHGVRSVVRRHLVPDWGAVADDYDAVHLSWAGLVTTEGYVSDLEDGGVAMLRYWGSERALWLSEVFGDPTPLGAPILSGRINGHLGTDVRVNEPRRLRDLEVIEALLGR